MTASRCTLTCMSDEGCTCRPSQPARRSTTPHVHAVDELRDGKLVRTFISTKRADWPGGIGDEPVFGEPAEQKEIRQ